MEIRAAVRTLNVHDQHYPTPLIIPSFSSRAKPPVPVWRFLQETLSAIGGPVLVSAYDIAHQPPANEVDVLEEIAEAAPSFVLLDSGGYEALWNEQAVAAGLLKEGSTPEWSIGDYRTVMSHWPIEIPLVAVSYDAPNEQRSIADQVASAAMLAADFKSHAIELLLKPSALEFDLMEIKASVNDLAQFPVIGITEKEIGASMAERLRFVSDLRGIFSDVGVDTPIHVFGGLDPQMTPLYFAAGADIFDGLSWLRYAFYSGVGIYDKSHIALHRPDALEKEELWQMRRRNIRQLVDLQVAMIKFGKSSDFGVFGDQGELIGAAWANVAVA